MRVTIFTPTGSAHLYGVSVGAAPGPAFARLRVPVASAPRGGWTIHVPRPLNGPDAEAR